MGEQADQLRDKEDFLRSFGSDDDEGSAATDAEFDALLNLTDEVARGRYQKRRSAHE